MITGGLRRILAKLTLPAGQAVAHCRARGGAHSAAATFQRAVSLRR